jgi:hypothetical protein
VKKMSTLVECGVKTSKNDGGEKINSSRFNNLVGSLRYLTCTHPYFFFEVGIVSMFMKTPIMTYLIIKGTVDFDLF